MAVSYPIFFKDYKLEVEVLCVYVSEQTVNHH